MLGLPDYLGSWWFSSSACPITGADGWERRALPPATQGEAAMPSASDNHSLNVLIRKLESIAKLSDEERYAILSLPVRTRVLKPGQDVVRDGDKPSQCCLLLDGWACRYKILSQGRRQIFSFHIPGDIPDLQSLHIDVMDHSLSSLTACKLMLIPHETMRDL